MKKFLKALSLLNLLLIINYGITYQLSNVQWNQDRWYSLGFLLFAWNFLLVKSYKLKLSENKHLIFIALFPIKLLIVSIDLFLSRSAIHENDKFSWVLCI